MCVLELYWASTVKSNKSELNHSESRVKGNSHPYILANSRKKMIFCHLNTGFQESKSTTSLWNAFQEKNICPWDSFLKIQKAASLEKL